MKLQAAAALKDELAAPIKVVLTGNLGTALADGATVPLQLDISSPYPHVPVVLSDLKLQATDGLQLVVTGLPETISLEPGATANATAQVGVTGSADSNSKVSLSAKVSSPWGKVLEKDLGLTFAPAIEGAAAVPPAPIKLPPSLLPIVGGVAALLVVAVLALLLVRMALTRPMDGVLTFTRDGREVADIVLRGRRQKLDRPCRYTGAGRAVRIGERRAGRCTA